MGEKISADRGAFCWRCMALRELLAILRPACWDPDGNAAASG